MPSVFKADDSFFPARRIGKALAQLYDLDGLTCSLHPAHDEEGNLAKCPLSLDSIVQNAAMLHAAREGTTFFLHHIWLLVVYDEYTSGTCPARSCDRNARN